jgi:hypothetical protein
MARPDFEKTWASSRPSIPLISDPDYALGFANYLGSQPPTTDDHDYIMNLQDSRAVWLGEQMLLAVGHEWQDDITYDQYAVVRSPVDGQLYRSLTAGNLNNEPSVSGSDWALGVEEQDSTDFLNSVRIDVPAASTVDLTALAPNTRHIRLTGPATINNFTVAAGQFYFVTVGAAQTVVNSASIVTQYGANISMQPGDTYCIGATAANVVYVWGYVKNIAEFPFTEVYESGELTWSSAGQVGPLAHGLGGFPKFITYEYRCIVNDAGYLAGQRVFVGQPTGQSASDGLAMAGDATNLNGRWGSTRVGAFINNTTGGITNLTSASWRVVVKAYI